MLNKALREAAKNELVVKNVVAAESAPKVDDEEMVIVKDIAGLVAAMRGHRFCVPAAIALFTGMRLGEVLALRWGRVDIDGKVIAVREALEETKAHGIRSKPPKSKAGRRDLTLPDILVDALRDFRKEQLELRLKLGVGKLPDDGLLFSDLEGGAHSSSAVSRAFSDFAARNGLADVTFHNLRHTHASQLIDAGVEIVTISKRLGHASPAITLAVYAHLFQKDDRKAAAAIKAALS